MFTVQELLLGTLQWIDVMTTDIYSVAVATIDDLPELRRAVSKDGCWQAGQRGTERDIRQDYFERRLGN
jgi:hypothetical protein